MTAQLPPIGMLAELTHRCPLQCPYCSNPLELLKANRELDTATWQSIFTQAADLGVLQVHLSGGEPTLRRDLEAIVGHLAARGVYANLITAGIDVKRERLFGLADAGLDHIQVSFQGARAATTELIGNHRGAHDKKLATARAAREAGLPLTINAPIHRKNIGEAEEFIALALDLDAERLEIANVQYYGWALANRPMLMPARDDVMRLADIVEEARERLVGVLAIDFVTPDYYAEFPKPCMGGWARDAFMVTPSGAAMPCHAAATIPGLTFDNAAETPLAEIWENSPAFEAFRGTAWMQEPCRTCPRREIDFGGCRCQALALAGDAAATDPACSLSPLHKKILAIAEADATAPDRDFIFRRIGAVVPEPAE
jgi:PqqA peptide cyclase